MALIRNRYRPVRRLANTTYGGIYLCNDEMIQSHRVVLKCVSLLRAIHLLDQHKPKLQLPDDPRQEKAFANFQRDSHHHLVEYLDDFIEGHTLCFVLEYCAGGDLYASVNRGQSRRLNCVDALAVIKQVAEGVAHLHSHGIAHRDLSLENIMLNGDVYKIGDFGLSTRTDELCFESVGKAYYMAPEVVAPTVRHDPKAADMWSLGIILFILVTGSPLVPLATEENSAFQVFMKVSVREVLVAWRMADVFDERAMELLDGLLQCVPKKRLTVEQVVSHDAFERKADAQ